MQIYPIEIKDGLKDRLANNTISIACELFTKDVPQDNEKQLLVKSLAKANPNQRDLYYKHSILASVGWNANDDVFDRLETWNARYSPVDKQINFMHNELEIIGHSTSSFVYDNDGKLIADDTTVDRLPDKFDVITEFVLYTMWDNEERKEMMDKLISEINEGKWFVSMECRFPAFDYAVIDVDGTHKTIARNENTAFLTKHLRAFGGTGEYEGRKLGRLIKNFFFSGQGIVSKPANTRSIIFNNALTFNSKGSLIIKESKQMEEDLKRQIAELKAQLDGFNKQKYEDTIAGLKEELKATKESLVAAEKFKFDKEEEDKKEKAKADSALSDKDKAIATLTNELKTANDKLVVASAELDSIKKDAATAARASKLVAAGVTAEAAKALVEKWNILDDARFDDIVAMEKARVDAEKAKATTTTTTEVTTASLEGAKTEPDAALNTASAEDKSADALKTIAAFLGGAMTYSSQAIKLETQNK